MSEVSLMWGHCPNRRGECPNRRGSQTPKDCDFIESVCPKSCPNRRGRCPNWWGSCHIRCWRGPDLGRTDWMRSQVNH